MEIKFVKGAFSNFDGTQEELDNLIKEITDLAESGQLLEQAVEIDLDDVEENDPELYKMLMKAYDDMIIGDDQGESYKNKLN